MVAGNFTKCVSLGVKKLVRNTKIIGKKAKTPSQKQILLKENSLNERTLPLITR